ncbi:Hypothetical predicted protein [Pelobates cultripes]|uniref:Uncharacterized protein n=1 Tax=Pelobates cultripes TaxID=61616 RepID=A0AAD1VYZ8_PELCU|nr:Hypothetical predicted protein [Pelobates cultripes]
MALTAPSPGEPHGAALERKGDELRTMAAAMATKADLLVLTTTIQDALRAEMAGIRAEVTAQTGRIQELERSQEAHTMRHQATDTALAHQGELLLHMRMSVEDLDNRGRRCNVRVRGVPALQERNIPYRWSFPFALLARNQNGWVSVRWPEEILRFLEELDLPPISIQDWVLGPLRPLQQRAPQRRGDNPLRGPAPRRRNNSEAPE